MVQSAGHHSHQLEVFHQSGSLVTCFSTIKYSCQVLNFDCGFNHVTNIYLHDEKFNGKANDAYCMLIGTIYGSLCKGFARFFMERLLTWEVTV